MSIRITTLIENSQGEHLSLAVEHGISFLIENEKHSVLFDTGQSNMFLSNAEKLGLDIHKVTHVVLSHGHYDHSGGFRGLVDYHKGFDLILGKGFFNKKYALFNGSCEYLGNDFDKTYLEEKKISHHFIDGNLMEIVEGIYVLSGFIRDHADEVISPRFVIRGESQFEQDTFQDEVMLAVDSPGGIVVILGCAHPGMKNMIDSAKRLLGRPVCAVLGGTHLVESSEESFTQSVNYLADEALRYVGVSHCTGSKAMEILKNTNSRYFHNRTGSSLFFD